MKTSFFSLYSSSYHFILPPPPCLAGFNPLEVFLIITHSLCYTKLAGKDGGLYDHRPRDAEKKPELLRASRSPEA